MARGQNYSREDDARIVADVAAKVPTYITARALRRTEAAISSRRCYLRGIGITLPPHYAAPRRRGGEEAPVPANVQRRSELIPCLKCRHDFRSEGAHNRLCPRCRHISVSPYAL